MTEHELRDIERRWRTVGPSNPGPITAAFDVSALTAALRRAWHRHAQLIDEANRSLARAHEAQNELVRVREGVLELLGYDDRYLEGYSEGYESGGQSER